MAVEVIHLVKNSETYGDSEMWCGGDEFGKRVIEPEDANCRECLNEAWKFGFGAQERLAELDSKNDS